MRDILPRKQFGTTNIINGNNNTVKIKNDFNDLFGTDDKIIFSHVLYKIEDTIWKYGDEDKITELLQKVILIQFGYMNYLIINKKGKLSINPYDFKNYCYDIYDKDNNIKRVELFDHINKYYQFFLTKEDSNGYLSSTKLYNTIVSIFNTVVSIDNESCIDILACLLMLIAWMIFGVAYYCMARAGYFR